MNSKFWRDKRVLVTGHTGFKGSWLLLWLRRLGANVYGFSLPPLEGSCLFRQADLFSEEHDFFGDIRQRDELKRCVDCVQPEFVFHLAAQPLVRESYSEPVATYESNVMGTAHLLESLRESKTVKAIVNITTDKVYENLEWYWPYRENDALGGYDPYSSSKACCELLTQAYFRSYYRDKGIGVATARAGNIIGGGDWTPDRLVPSLVRAMLDNDGIELRYPDSVRPWQHVLEPLAGYLLLAERLASEPTRFSSSWNFGPFDPIEWSVDSVARFFAALCEQDIPIVHSTGVSPHEAGQLRLDISKASKELGWRPVWSVEHGLKAVFEWHDEFESGVSASSLCERQIEEYEAARDRKDGAT